MEDEPRLQCRRHSSRWGEAVLCDFHNRSSLEEMRCVRFSKVQGFGVALDGVKGALPSADVTK